MLTKSQDFALPPYNASILTDGVHRFLRFKGYRVEEIPDPYSKLIQGQKAGILRDLSGFSSSVKVRIWPEGSGLRVQTVSERWLIRSAVTLIGFMVPPLFLVPALGGYFQFKDIEELWTEINKVADKIMT